MIQTQEEIFKQVWKDSDDYLRKQQRINDVKINAKNDSYFLTPLLRKHNFTTWKQISDEAELIFHNQSKLSSKLRGAINHIHSAVLMLYGKQYDTRGVH